jgi:hypothetical protein
MNADPSNLCPSSMAKAQALYDCTCMNCMACQQSVCASPPQEPSQQCQLCVATTCQNELNECFNDTGM